MVAKHRVLVFDQSLRRFNYFAAQMNVGTPDRLHKTRGPDWFQIGQFRFLFVGHTPDRIRGLGKSYFLIRQGAQHLKDWPKMRDEIAIRTAFDDWRPLPELLFGHLTHGPE